MAVEKLIYVPRNWKVSYVDDIGNEHKNIPLSADKEYRVIEDGIPMNITVGGIRSEEGKTYIVPKTELASGYMYVITTPEHEIDMDKVSDITRIRTRYNRATRSNKDKTTTPDDEVFIFAFDSEKYSSKYKISVSKGEFVAVAVPDPKNSGKSRAYYGHITGISEDDQYVVLNRYISNHGVREIKCGFKIPIANLLGIYRYELEIEDWKEPEAVATPVEEPAPEAEPISETACDVCDVPSEPDPEPVTNAFNAAE